MSQTIRTKKTRGSRAHTTAQRRRVEPRPPDLTDRMTIRERPSGPALLQQTWDKLLFMHWPIELAALRPLIPRA